MTIFKNDILIIKGLIYSIYDLKFISRILKFLSKTLRLSSKSLRLSSKTLENAIQLIAKLWLSCGSTYRKLHPQLIAKLNHVSQRFRHELQRFRRKLYRFRRKYQKRGQKIKAVRKNNQSMNVKKESKLFVCSLDVLRIKLCCFFYSVMRLCIKSVLFII